MAEDISRLVADATAGDRDAFARLIDLHERAALSTAMAVLGDAEDAGEAVQEAFIRAWQQLHRLDEMARFPGWLMVIVRRAALDIRRRRRNAATQLDQVAAPVWKGTGPAGQLEEQERSQRVAKALDGLDPISREAVMLRYFGRCSSREIAEILGLTPSAVDTRLSRARDSLKVVLAAEYSATA